MMTRNYYTTPCPILPDHLTLTVMLGFSGELSFAIDLEGYEFGMYTTESISTGGDASLGVIANYHSPLSRDISISDLEGFGISKNLGVGPFDFSYGGDQGGPIYNLYGESKLYNSYGFGMSAGPLPGSFNISKGHTQVLFRFNFYPF